MRRFGNAVATPALLVCHTLPMRSERDTIGPLPWTFHGSFVERTEHRTLTRSVSEGEP